jgi:DNA repair and recombination protein RAD54B
MEQKKIGQERAKELHKITQTFMLRRTQEVLEKFLPPKHDLVLFCAPTDLQIELYKAYLTCEDVRSLKLSYLPTV